MDPQRLSAIATNAIEHTLRYHLGQDVSLDKDDKALVGDAVEEVFHLRERARDIQVAHLEIACDVAVTFAEAFNERNTEAQHINLRWFYICVQSLLVNELKPELLQDGQVDRLSRLIKQHGGTPQPHEYSETDSSSSFLSSAGDDDRSHETSVGRSVTIDRGSPVVMMKDPKTKWEDEELQQMMQLKKSGLTHKAIAERLGRTQSAVENKYGRMMHSRAVSDPTPKRLHHKEDEEEDEGEERDDEQPVSSRKRIRRTI